jgi:hypothetical protein
MINTTREKKESEMKRKDGNLSEGATNRYGERSYTAGYKGVRENNIGNGGKHKKKVS